MAIYYKFKSAKDYDLMPIESQFISVACLKRRIFESKYMEKGTDYDLIISNSQTNEEYVDDNAIILKNMAVLIRRVPGLPRKPIVVEREERKHNKVEENPTLNCVMTSDSSTEKYAKEFDSCDFGDDIYSIPEVPSTQSGTLAKDQSPESNILEEEKIKSLVETPALKWNRHGDDSYGGNRGFERSMIRRMMSGNCIGQGGFERKTPPIGYICHRCKVSGHFIQHCPTNGDPNYDVKRVKPPTGITRSMLMVTPDGSDLLPSAAAAVLKPNEPASEEEIMGLHSTHHVVDLPPELCCPLCKELMKNAIFTRNCCFRSFCDKCIREYVITNSTCVCGTIDVQAGDLIPNKTLRDTIIRILNSTTTSTITSNSSDNGGSVILPSIESARYVHSKAPSPPHSAASKDDQKASSTGHGQCLGVKGDDDAVEGKTVKDYMHCLDRKTTTSTNMSETTSRDSLLVSHEVQEKLLENGEGKKMKKKKVYLQHRATNMQWRDSEELKIEGYTMMPSASLARDHYMAPFGAGTPFMGYPFGSFDGNFDRMLLQNQFAAQLRMHSAVLPRELSELAVNSTGINWGNPSVKDEFEPRKFDCRNQHKFEQHGERKHSRDDKEIGNDGSSAKRSRFQTVIRDRSQKLTNFDCHLDHKLTNLDRYNGHSDRAPEKLMKRSRSPNDHKDDNGCKKKKKQCLELSELSMDEHNFYRRLKEPSTKNPCNNKGRMEKEDEEDCHFKRKLSWSSSAMSFV